MRREYVGGAQAARLSAPLGGTTSDLTISCNNLANWPTGTGGTPFYVVVDRGMGSEEKILCESRSGNTLTVYDDGITNGRGADDTSIASHSSNAVIEHVFTATDADEANEHVNDSTNDVHDQYILKSEYTAEGSLLTASAAAVLAEIPIGTEGDVLTVSSGVPAWEAPAAPPALPDIISPLLLMGA
jgi:hypothetical protein